MSSNQSNSFESGSSIQPIPPERVLELFYGFNVTQIIYVTAKLGLANRLNNSAKTCEELAVELGVNAKVLHHIMRFLIYLGFVTVDKNQIYQLTPFGSYLRSDTPNSLVGTALSVGSLHYPTWENLWHSLQTGKAAFDQTFKMGIYDYLAQNSEANTYFNQWIEEITRDRNLPILSEYDFSSIGHFVDVGGGTGILTAAVLKQHSHLQATLFEQPHVISEANKLLNEAGVSERCQIVEGDFFDSIPEGGDLYILSRVLLNWDDDNALTILKNCRAAMSPPAKLLIMDFVLPNQDETIHEVSLSLALLLLFDRLLRTEDEYYGLISKAGFQSPKIVKRGTINFIEATVG